MEESAAKRKTKKKSKRLRDTQAAYAPTPGCYDEMYADSGKPRGGLKQLHRSIKGIGPRELEDRGRLRDTYLAAQDITFTLAGRERPLPMDLIPRVIQPGEWGTISKGVSQRIYALEAFLADVYGPGQIMSDRVVPRALVTSSNHFHRQAHGITPPNGVRVHVAGVDLIRDEKGEFRVLEDNLRNPSGVSYVLENRRTQAHVVPEVFRGHVVHPVSEYPERLLRALTASAPSDVHEPTIVVLTPGVYNSAHFEHAFLARRMGVELVEGRDLFCRGGFVYMRTTQGPKPVHVIYRRIDDDYLDPLHFRPDSVLGIPGLLNAARDGTVSVANGIGNGVGDDKALYSYLPEIIKYYLGQEPILKNVDTYRLEDPDQREHVLSRLDRMVVKPVDGSGGYGLVIGSSATEEELAKAERDIRADPRGWIAQPIVQLSTTPTVSESGQLEPRHVDLRPFAVNDGNEVWVLPGGLTRAALTKGSMVVNSSQGGGSKDTWVLSGKEPERRRGWRGPDDMIAQGLRTRSVATDGSNTPSGPTPRDHSPRMHEHRIKQQSMQQQQSDNSSGSEASC